MNVRSLEADLVEKNTTIKALTIRFRRLENDCDNLRSEKESLRVAKEEIMNIPVNRTKRSAKGTVELSASVHEDYLGLAL